MQDAATTLEPRAVSASQGLAWITEGFRFFKLAPGPWIGMFVLWVVIYAAASLIPLGGLATSILGPVFTAGWMLACRALDTGDPLKVEHLFAAFRGHHLGQLALVGAIYLAGVIAIVLLVAAIVGGTMLPVLLGNAKPQDIQFGYGIIIGGLLIVGLTIPLLMAIWFAPALVVFDNQQPVDAMKLSMRACWANLIPFLVYGIVGLVLLILAMIPLCLGLLILGPVLIASVYAGYRDVFAAPASVPA